MSHQNQSTPKSPLDSLYCSEESLEEQECHYEENSDYLISETPPFVDFSEQDLFWDGEELKTLLTKEQSNEKLCFFLMGNRALAVERNEAVDWILKVNAHYSFSTLTAVLAVNYLDRFILGFMFLNLEKRPWFIHLAALACLSIASKVEETYVPIPVDLQVEETKYDFEAKEIKKMEILVLTKLDWKMNPTTPLSFIDYITRRLGLKGYICCEFLRRCKSVLLSVFAEPKFMCYLPSVLASATMLHVIKNVERFLGIEYQKQLLGILGINKAKVKECYKMILKHITESRINKRKFGSIHIIPSSPNGVNDVSFSFDNSSNESTNSSVSSSSSPQLPLSKKARTQLT